MATISICLDALEAGLQAEKDGDYKLALENFRMCDRMFEDGSDWNPETFYAHRNIQEQAQEHYQMCKKKLWEAKHSKENSNN